jgi:GNAT superfamily N-acetyltransferase
MSMKPDVAAAGVVDGCQILDWDSAFFGHIIARVEPSALRAGGAAAVEEWCTTRQVDCAYLLVDADDQATCDLAPLLGFRLADVRMTFEASGPPAPFAAGPAPSDVEGPGGPIVRPVRQDDVEQLKAIARESHRDTRFYMDAHFDRRRCDDLYELWIARSCDGWADRVFVAETGGCAVGYVTCHVREDEGQIGLVGVSAARRRHGSGRALIWEARRWFAEQGIERVSVATQGRNASGLQLYQRAGMTIRSIQFWFHKWF